ncbi:hypothetical protein AAMO2058_001744500 [Amorphochlora amoebiformis]
MGLSDRQYDILITSTSGVICLACICSLIASSKRLARVKLAASTQRTFVGLTLGSALFTMCYNGIELFWDYDRPLINLIAEILNRSHVIMDLWCNSYLMIFWLKVHFFVRYRSENTLFWLWWTWAVLNMTFMLFHIGVSGMYISSYLTGTYRNTQFYRIEISANVVMYLLVPTVVAGFGVQLYQLFKFWGASFRPALASTLRRIAAGTIVVCLCFFARAIVLICVLCGAFSGQQPETIFVFYFFALIAIPQIIALYIMAILLPHQGPVPSNASGEMKKGESFSVSLPEDNGIYAASHEMNDGLINIDNNAEDIVWRTWSFRHDTPITNNSNRKSIRDEADVVDG